MIKAAILGVMMATGTMSAIAEGREGFVDLAGHIPGIVVETRYAGNDNFLGRPVEGYLAAKSLMSREAADALAGVQADLVAKGYTLKVFDSYRPQRAVDDFMAWIANGADTKNKAEYYPGISKDRLVPEGYIAKKSGHTRGSTIDLTIASVGDDGALTELDMGSPWDFFGPISHALNADIPPEARENRALLRGLMLRHGFKPYEAEWWHFTLAEEPYPDTYFDFPVE